MVLAPALGKVSRSLGWGWGAGRDPGRGGRSTDLGRQLAWLRFDDIRAPQAGPGEWGRTSQLSPCGARCCRARPRPRSAHLARLLPLWAPVWWRQRLPACDRPRQALCTALQTRVGAGGCQFEVVLWKITCLLFVCCGSTKMSGEGILITLPAHC